VEAGLQFTIIDARDALGEKPAAAGGRVTIGLLPFLDAEVEINRFPIGGAVSNFPGTQFLFGARAGKRIGSLGLFAKVRPGFTRFDATVNSPTLGTRPVLDFGGIVEYYSRHHIAARFDFGDAIVFYGAGQPAASGTRHQFQGGFGVSVWF
jgi:hypothetical protein